MVAKIRCRAPSPAVLPLQLFPEEPERYRRLRGGAGLGDDVDGEIVVPQQIHDFLQTVGGEAVARKVDVWSVLLFQVVVGGAEAVDDASGTQIGAADADDHQRFGAAPDFGGGLLYPLIFRAVKGRGQMHPACEIAALADSLLQAVLRQLQPGRERLFVGHGDKIFEMKKSDIQHDGSSFPILM